MIQQKKKKKRTGCCLLLGNVVAQEERKDEAAEGDGHNEYRHSDKNTLSLRASQLRPAASARKKRTRSFNLSCSGTKKPESTAYRMSWSIPKRNMTAITIANLINQAERENGTQKNKKKKHRTIHKAAENAFS
jgi:hypothetical protein